MNLSVGIVGLPNVVLRHPSTMLRVKAQDKVVDDV